MNQAVASVTARASEDAPALLHEMIRSFTTLARTLNLSQAVRELGSTRQTVRRHIAYLEEAMGVKLFALEDRHYRLTDSGRKALPEALDILVRGHSWLKGHVTHHNGMQCVHALLPEGRSFWLQQKPLGQIWSCDRSLLRECFRAWALAGGELEHPAMTHVRPYFMVYRDSPSGWICVEIGEESSYVSWSGWAAARSSIGRGMYSLPAGAKIAHLMVEPFDQAALLENPRLDHLFTQLRREADGPFIPICYRRLLLAGRFPDGTFALISVVDRCNDIHIDGLHLDASEQMSEDLIMPKDPVELKYERKP